MARRRWIAWAAEFGVALLFLLFAVILTWPLVPNLRTAVSDPGDPWLNTWILHWDHWATFNAPGDLFDAYIFHPAPQALAFSENLYGIALLTMPFYLAGAAPLTVYNIAVLLGFSLCGYGAYVLGRVVSGNRAAAILGGIIFEFVPFRWDHLSHLQIIWAGWLPLLLAALLYYRRRPSMARAVLFGVAFLFNGLTNIHWLLFGSFAVFATLGFLLIIDGIRTFRRWLPLLGATVVALLLLLPFLLPYEKVASMHGMKRWRGENLDFSATWSDWLSAPKISGTYGSLRSAREGRPERRLFPGLGVLFLMTSAFLLARPSWAGGLQAAPSTEEWQRGADWRPPPHAPPRRRTRITLRVLDGLIVVFLLAAYLIMAEKKIVWEIGDFQVLATSSGIPLTLALVLFVIRCAIRFPSAMAAHPEDHLSAYFQRSRFSAEFWSCLLWVLIGFACSFGLNGFLHSFLYETVEAFHSVRVPARWAMIAYTGMAGLAAAGAALLLRGTSLRRNLTAAALAMILLYELRPGGIRWYLSEPTPAPVYTWLKQTPPDTVVVEFPMGTDGPEEILYALGQTHHHRRIVNGASGFEPVVHRQFVALARTLSPSLLGALERVGTDLIVVHGEAVSARYPDFIRWIERGLDTGRLRFVGRFDHFSNGDFVFAITRNAPATLRGPTTVDGAGHTADENLRRFLAREPTYSGVPFGYVDQPKSKSVVRGPLRISGWALAPEGISAVNARLQNGRVSVPLQFSPRPDVQKNFPWYPKVGLPGFNLELPQRPREVDLDTDLQLEIVDGEGRVTRLKPIFFRWVARPSDDVTSRRR